MKDRIGRMGRMGRGWAGVGLGVVLGAAGWGLWPVGAQTTMPNSGYNPPVYGRPAVGGDKTLEEPRDGGVSLPRMEHMREDDRHKRLVADTARLVALSNELKAEVDKASKDELSLDVVRKAAEIEKLARDVKERMKS